MRTTTASYKECLYKLLFFASTIIVELLLGYTSSSNSYTAFYLTVLVQAVNNFYDASGDLDTGKFSLFCIFRTSITMLASVGAFGLSICYISSSSKSDLRVMLSSEIAIYIVVAMLVIIVVFLIVELIIHFMSLYEQEANVHHVDTINIVSSQKRESVFYDGHGGCTDLCNLYRHGENDILYKMPDRQN